MRWASGSRSATCARLVFASWGWPLAVMVAISFALIGAVFDHPRERRRRFPAEPHAVRVELGSRASRLDCENGTPPPRSRHKSDAHPLRAQG